MTSRYLLMWSLGLAFGLLPLAGGCQQESVPPVQQAVAGATTTNQAVNPAPPGDAATAAAAEASEAELADAPVTPITPEKAPPPKIRPNSPVAELVKLANSGVDESVLLAFVNNSPHTFNLQADEIIYLNDIGVPGTVVTAMLQHDQNFAATHTNNPPAAPEPAPAPAPAPDYATAPPVEAPLTPPENTEYPFYDSLAPYGNWVNVDGYGPCWQPSVVVINPTWQPYFDGGHWLYTDCGWYWASDYSWGWAPFHYGRWFRHHHLGWCWAPDHVWGPSWVSWRYSDDYCGWAPLPPGVTFTVGFGLGWHGHRLHDGDDCGLGYHHFRFVPWHSFREHHLHGYAVAGRDAERVYQRTTVVNRFVVNNNTIINHGISASRVAAATHQVVEPVKVRDASAAVLRTGRAEHFDSSTRSISVYRPQIPPTRNTAATSTARPGFTPTRSTATTGAPSAGQQFNDTTSTHTAIASPHATGNSPMILRGQQSVAPATPAPAAPSSSLVVIGRQGNTRGQVPTRTPTTAPSVSSSQPQTTVAERDNSYPNRANNPAVTSAQRPAWNNSATAQPAPRTDNGSRATPWLDNRPSASPAPSTASRQYTPNYQAPVRTAPNVPQYNPAPAYGSQRSYSAPNPTYRPQPTPSPSYNAPSRPAPAPSYSAPSRPTYSAPAPSYSAPSRSDVPRSAPAPSYSGGGGGGARSAPSSPPASSGRSDSGNKR